MHWDAARYDTDFSFVTGYGEELLDLLELQPGARVLDVGCGTGAHAGALAARGYDVLGVDVDEAMLERARTSHPHARFLAADVQTMTLGETFDAALSNAALHWMPDQAAALVSIRAALLSGAPFVAEMGGAHNVEIVDRALVEAAAHLDLEVPAIRKFFPTVGQEAALLEAAGFEISWMRWFPRWTPLQPGQTPADWSRVFRADLWEAVPRDRWQSLSGEIDARCGELRSGEQWAIDYRRLRFLAHAA